jgi:HEAT repeat protein
MFEDDPASETTFLYELARDADTDALVAYLTRGETPTVRRRTAEVLGDLSERPLSAEAEETVVQALMRAAREDEADSVRARAIDALYRYGRDALDRLISEMAEVDVEDAPEWVTTRTLVGWLDADYPEFRMVAAAALGRRGGAEAVQPLVEALTDPAPRVRELAARSCGRLGDGRCVPALADRLDDRNPLVRRAAANALGAIGTERALRALVPAARADDDELRRVAVDELGQFGSLEPAVVLLRALEDDTASIQRAALLSLIQLFVEAPDEDAPDVRETVADQLARMDTAAVVPVVLDVMAESQRWVVRRNGAWLLGRVIDPDSDHVDAAYDCLIDALDDEDDLTADLAAASLVDLASEELERRLLVLASDDDGSEAALDRARAILAEIGSGPDQELVTNSVDYTYVTDPADYTKQKREDDGDDT